MSDIAEFPLPADATPEERRTASRDIGTHAKVVEETGDGVRFEGKLLGRTGPIWRFQYTRVYQVADGFIAAGHELREGIVVFHSTSLDTLGAAIPHEGVREFIEDELRFRGHLKEAHASV